MRAVLDSWDAFELWLTQLAFPLQVLLALVVIVPVCWGAAAGIDRLLDHALDRRWSTSGERPQER